MNKVLLVFDPRKLYLKEFLQNMNQVHAQFIEAEPRRLYMNLWTALQTLVSHPPPDYVQPTELAENELYIEMPDWDDLDITKTYLSENSQLIFHKFIIRLFMFVFIEHMKLLYNIIEINIIINNFMETYMLDPKYFETLKKAFYRHRNGIGTKKVMELAKLLKSSCPTDVPR